MNGDIVIKNYFRLVFAVLVLALAFALVVDHHKSGNSSKRLGLTIRLENNTP